MKYQYLLAPGTDRGEYLMITVDNTKDSRDPKNWIISLIKKNKETLPLQAKNINIARDGGTIVITLDSKNNFKTIYIPSPANESGYKSDEEDESPFILQHDGKKIIMQESDDIILDKKPAIQKINVPSHVEIIKDLFNQIPNSPKPLSVEINSQGNLTIIFSKPKELNQFCSNILNGEFNECYRLEQTIFFTEREILPLINFLRNLVPSISKKKSLIEKEESNQEECTERTNLIIEKQDSNIKKDELRNKIFSKLNALKKHSKDVEKPFFFSYLSANSEKSAAINNFANQVELLLNGEITSKTSYVELVTLKHRRELGFNRNKFTCFWKNETKTQTLINEIFQDMESLKR